MNLDRGVVLRWCGTVKMRDCEPNVKTYELDGEAVWRGVRLSVGRALMRALRGPFALGSAGAAL